MTGRLMHVMLNVADIDRSLAFYAMLGMRVQVDRGDAAAGRRNLFLGYGPEAEHALIELASPAEAPAPSFGHVALAVPDVIGLCDRLAAGGVAVLREPRRLGSGTITAFVGDPDGHRLELVQPAGSGLTRRAVRHDGLEFLVLEGSDGPPLLMLHGGASRADHFTELMARLDGRLRTIAYDQRGFAGSAAPATAAIDHAHWAGDVIGVMDALEIDRAALLGWSMGASIAINAAHRRPDRIAAIVLLGAPDPRRPVDVERLRDRQRESDTLSEDARRMRDAEAIRHALAPAARADEAIVARLLAERAATAPAAHARAIEGYATRPDLTELLPELRCPIHLIAGEDDPMCPPAAAEVIRRYAPHATLDRVVDCGHYYALEQPDTVARIVLDRLDGAPPR